MYKKIKIKGFRGFQQDQELPLAVPDGNSGSGLTAVVGPNNSGKSTIYESFRSISQGQSPSFTEGKRNKIAGDKVLITLENIDGKITKLQTVKDGGSETIYSGDIAREALNILALPSRRTFEPFFDKSQGWNRESYIKYSHYPATRGQGLLEFNKRLFSIQENQQNFNDVLTKVIGPVPKWHIDQNDGGRYYIKFNYNGNFHNSDGAGEGITSIFTIVDTLYDSQKGDVIVIDEPELSLHPAFQKKLSKLINDYSKDRQIVIFTHSPFFIDWYSIMNGGKLSRVVKTLEGSKIYHLSTKTVEGLKGLLNNVFNPHILGLDAKELFFLEDDIILVEGQEDVVYFRRIIELLNITLEPSFFGWGAGGVGNMSKILSIFENLGFQKVSVILDGNVEADKIKLEASFPIYKFHIIPADDVRDKPRVEPKDAVEGLIDRSGKKLKENHREELENLFKSINDFHKSSIEVKVPLEDSISE